MLLFRLVELRLIFNYKPDKTGKGLLRTLVIFAEHAGTLSLCIKHPLYSS